MIPNTYDWIWIGVAESPGGFATGPSVGSSSDAPNIAPYSLFLNLIIFPLAFALHIYYWFFFFLQTINTTIICIVFS